jgi:copper chaperone CopZ
MIRRKAVILAASLTAVLFGVALIGSAHLDVRGTGAAALAPGAVSDPARTIDRAAAEAVVRFHIPTITCAEDPMRVEANVRQASGILNVAFDGRDAIITYDPAQVTPDQLAAAIEAGGDLVDLVPA